MTKRKNKELETIELFIAKLMNIEQSSHAKLIADLKKIIDNTQEFSDTVKVLTKIYEAKIKILEKVYKRIQEI